MARHDTDHDDDRGHFGDSRDDNARQHRSSGRGKEFGDTREHHFSRFDETYSQARGAGYRDRLAADPGDRRRGHAWDGDTDYSHTVGWSPAHHQARHGSHADGAWGGRGQYDAWSMDGPFVGRGPRGYRRSDERIKEDICEVLTRHGRVDASDIDLYVDHGVVTLQGTVDGRRTKRLVEDIVDEVLGVRDIRNQLRISRWDEDSPRYRSSGESAYRARDDDASHSLRDRDMEQRSYTDSEGETTSPPGAGRFVASSGSEHRERLREGMEVLGSDGEAIGDVKEISNNSFLVDRPMHRDVFVPFSAIQSMSGNRIALSVLASEVDDQGWATPDLMGSHTGEDKR